MGLDTEGDVISYAIALMAKLVDLASRGGKFLVEEPDGRTKEIIFPGMENAEK